MDTSEKLLGDVLYQVQDDGTSRVLAYNSRTLSKSEKNYDGQKIEYLAIKWVITYRFHEYLYGGDFEVFTNDNPLTYLLTTAKLDATGQRWVVSLVNYNFKLHYRSGKHHVEANVLSRSRWEQEEALHTLDALCLKQRSVGDIVEIIPSLRYLHMQFQQLLKVLQLMAPQSTLNIIGKWNNKPIQT